MQFIEDGPDIPDELLLALDEGRVVFFCGAGVSLAKAGLPDFFGLADQVRTTLGDLDDSLAAKTLKVARDLDKQTGVPGLISADRVFSLLERVFRECDIEPAVAQALTPKNNVDLGAHELLLDLATTREGVTKEGVTKEGVTKLVTTNFDRLFDDCGRKLKVWQPPRLPDPARPDELNGIVYLHGRATEDYNGAECDGFILSSAEFGRAYLAEGWATRFFKDVIDRYVVVFVGYSADDPPVQYLLEALNKTNDRMDQTYAFQSGDANAATSLWMHKGVSAIPYDSKNKHKALWDTLEQWAERKKNLEGWQENIIAMARLGPETLSSFKREQVAHLVSTKEGARKFSESDPPAPASWLCVFDPSVRYSNPDQDIFGNVDDPFSLYGLKSDDVPPAFSPENPTAQRKKPTAALDVFALNRRDRLEFPGDHISPLRGGPSLIAGMLPGRINLLGEWIGKISNQPDAVWWGARQSGLHVEIQRRISRNLSSSAKYEPIIRQAWRFMFEHWRVKRDEEHYSWSDFRDEVASDGWNKKTIRNYENLSCPRLVVGGSLRTAVPWSGTNSLKFLMSLKLACDKNDRDVSEIPDERLADVVSAKKRNLEIGIWLGNKAPGVHWRGIAPITHSHDHHISENVPYKGFSGAVISYSVLFKRLLDLDVEQARQEVATWPTGEKYVFARLRIWASRFEALVPNEDFDEFFGKFSCEVFWYPFHETDLLLTLKERWADLPVFATSRLENRILEGPRTGDKMYKARKIADRLHRLHSSGCNLNVNYEDEIRRQKVEAPYWTPERAENADLSQEIRRGVDHTNTEHSDLVLERLPMILAKAQELRGLEIVDPDPFEGLSESHPVMALSALRLEAKGGMYPEREWRIFLHHEKRKKDNDRLKNFIAELLVSANDEALKGIAYSVAVWLLFTSEHLTEKCVPIFERLVRRLLDFLSDNPNVGDTGAPDGPAEALHPTAGKVVEALYNDPRRKDLVERQGLPVEWRSLVENALALPGDSGRFALVSCSLQLNWFYHVDPEWTDEKLLSVLRTNDTKTSESWWASFLWEVRKPHFLEKAVEPTYEDKLATLILECWRLSGPKIGAEVISDKEFREVLLKAGDRFRSCVLRYLAQWSIEDGERGELWKPLRVPFLHQVWPIQKEARTPHSSAQLIELAFSDEEGFVDVSEAISRLISRIDGDNIVFSSIQQEKKDFIKKYPKPVLEILYLVLPENASSWPNETNEILKYITIADPLLQADTRWVELNRRWNSM